MAGFAERSEGNLHEGDGSLPPALGRGPACPALPSEKLSLEEWGEVDQLFSVVHSGITGLGGSNGGHLEIAMLASQSHRL